MIAVRDSEIDVDYGYHTSTISGAAISIIEKVDGPESGHPEVPDGPDVYFTLDEHHGVYAGKRGRWTKVTSMVDGPPDGHFGKYFEVEFPGDPTPVCIAEDCVYGGCRRDAPDHPELWYFKAR